MMYTFLYLPLLAALLLYAHAATAKSNTAPNLHFIENQGQVTDQHHQPRPDIHYKLSAGNGLNIFLGTGMLHYVWASPIAQQSGHSALSRTAGYAPGAAFANEAEAAAPAFNMHRVDVAFIGANPNAAVTAEGVQDFYERYFQPWVNTRNSNAGVIARAYTKITYKEVYPHIDWVFYFNNNGQLEHDFVVRPGGRVADIRLQYNGATTLQLLPDGSLDIQSPLGHITEQVPYSYDEKGRGVPSRYVLEGNVLSFAVDACYNGTLTIDPMVAWGTYFGGTDEETGRAVATGPKGNIYLVGSTGSTANIATSGAYQTTYGGGKENNGADGFITKWDSAGNLIWATYYGGTGIDVCGGMACDTSGNVYAGGYTRSTTSIATTGSHQPAKAGSATRYDAFIVKFDPSGQRQWATYYGGTNDEASITMALTCDRFNNIYITGNTSSTSGIATTGAYQATLGFANDGFLAKFSADGRLIWGTYYGGNGNDFSQGIASDTSGNIYLTGYTVSGTTGIATTGAHQTSPAGAEDVFLAKFDPDGQLEWGTYFGGAAQDRGHALATYNDRVWLAGISGSTTSIATPGSFQPAFAGGTGNDGFLASFDASGSLLWSTYYGGDKADGITSIVTNTAGYIYMAGLTFSDSGISSPRSYQPQIMGTGNSDLFLVKFNSSGQRQWGTYYGGLDGEQGGYLALDNSGSIYLTGQTASTSGIATSEAYQTALNGNNDALLVAFYDCESPQMPDSIIGPTIVCSGAENSYVINKVAGASSYTWLLPAAWKQTNAADTMIRLTTHGNSGLLQVVAISACGGVSDTQSVQITVHPLPEPVIEHNNHILFTNQAYNSYQWLLNETDIEGADQPTYMPTANGSYSVRVSNEYDCINTSDTVNINGITAIREKGMHDNFILYPNPANGYVLIKAPEKASARIYGIDGRLLKSNIPVKEGENKITLDGCATGIYWLKIATANNFLMYKLIVR